MFVFPQSMTVQRHCFILKKAYFKMCFGGFSLVPPLFQKSCDSLYLSNFQGLQMTAALACCELAGGAWCNIWDCPVSHRE